MKKYLLLAAVLCVVCSFAHEFWLSPQRFFYRIRENATIRFYVGEDFAGENWSGNRSKIRWLKHCLPSGKVMDLSESISDNKGDSLTLPLSVAGTHMVTFYSHNSFIQLGAEQFNAYLREDGLDAAMVYRKEHGEENLPGKEYYCRSVKTILQAGEEITDNCSEPTGLPLDIVPENNPYAPLPSLVKEGAIKTRFRLLFYGKPMVNEVVKIWYQVPGKKADMTELRTNRNGWITAERKPGRCMVSCVHMERNTSDTAAQWQSYWGSLSFEFPQFFAGRATK